MKDRELPVNARIETEDGVIIPLELVYAGCDHGIDLWSPAYQIEIPRGGKLKVDHLPRRASIAFNIEPA